MSSIAAEQSEKRPLEIELAALGVHKDDLTKDQIQNMYFKIVGKRLAKSGTKYRAMAQLEQDGGDRVAIARALLAVVEQDRKENPRSEKCMRERKQRCAHDVDYYTKEAEDRVAVRKLFAHFPKEEKQICRIIEQMSFRHISGYMNALTERGCPPSHYEYTLFKLARTVKSERTIRIQSASFDVKTNRLRIGFASPVVFGRQEYKDVTFEARVQREEGTGLANALEFSLSHSFACDSAWTRRGVVPVRYRPDPHCTYDTYRNPEFKAAASAESKEPVKAPAVKHKLEEKAPHKVANPEEEEDDEEEDNTPITQLKRMRVEKPVTPA